MPSTMPRMHFILCLAVIGLTLGVPNLFFKYDKRTAVFVKDAHVSGRLKTLTCWQKQLQLAFIMLLLCCKLCARTTLAFCPHFANEKIEAWRLNNLPSVSQLINDRDQIQLRLDNHSIILAKKNWRTSRWSEEVKKWRASWWKWKRRVKKLA